MRLREAGSDDIWGAVAASGRLDRVVSEMPEPRGADDRAVLGDYLLRSIGGAFRTHDPAITTSLRGCTRPRLDGDHTLLYKFVIPRRDCNVRGAAVLVEFGRWPTVWPTLLSLRGVMATGYDIAGDSDLWDGLPGVRVDGVADLLLAGIEELEADL